jgi:hypothetical protein
MRIRPKDLRNGLIHIVRDEEYNEGEIGGKRTGDINGVVQLVVKWKGGDTGALTSL